MTQHFGAFATNFANSFTRGLQAGQAAAARRQQEAIAQQEAQKKKQAEGVKWLENVSKALKNNDLIVWEGLKAQALSLVNEDEAETSKVGIQVINKMFSDKDEQSRAANASMFDAMVELGLGAGEAITSIQQDPSGTIKRVADFRQSHKEGGVTGNSFRVFDFLRVNKAPLKMQLQAVNEAVQNDPGNKDVRDRAVGLRKDLIAGIKQEGEIEQEKRKMQALQQFQQATAQGANPRTALGRAGGAVDPSAINAAVNIQRQEESESIVAQGQAVLADALSRKFADSVAKIANTRTSILTARANVDIFRKALAKGIKTNFGGQLFLNLGRAAELLGLDDLSKRLTGNLPSSENALAAAKRLILDIAPGAKSLDSAKEFEILAQALPALTTTRAGNALIIESLDAILAHRERIANAANDVLSTAGTPQNVVARAELGRLQKANYIGPELSRQIEDFGDVHVDRKTAIIEARRRIVAKSITETPEQIEERLFAYYSALGFDPADFPDLIEESMKGRKRPK